MKAHGALVCGLLVACGQRGAEPAKPVEAPTPAASASAPAQAPATPEPSASPSDKFRDVFLGAALSQPLAGGEVKELSGGIMSFRHPGGDAAALHDQYVRALTERGWSVENGLCVGTAEDEPCCAHATHPQVSQALQEAGAAYEAAGTPVDLGCCFWSVTQEAGAVEVALSEGTGC